METIIKHATIKNIDCMEYMRTLPDKYFDLAIVDPPYGIDVAKYGNVGFSNLAASTNYMAKDWDVCAPSKDYFYELMRVSVNKIIWGANHFVDRIPCAASPCWIVWDKDNTGKFADCELACTSFKTAVRKFEFRWNGMLQGDMKNKEKRNHPTQKPIKLYEWILTNYAEPGQKIFDSHMGSGSSAIACNNLGFEYVGCELDEDYYQAACKRIKNYASQMTLF